MSLTEGAFRAMQNNLRRANPVQCSEDVRA
jgi:hypothetical protein